MNLLIIEAVEGFAYNHHITSSEALEIFNKYNIIMLYILMEFKMQRQYQKQE